MNQVINYTKKQIVGKKKLGWTYNWPSVSKTKIANGLSENSCIRFGDLQSQ